MGIMEEKLSEELWKDYEELTKKQMEQYRFNTQKALERGEERVVSKPGFIVLPDGCKTVEDFFMLMEKAG